MAIYKKSVVAYVDILGFKEAIIENFEPELLQKFVALLKEYENSLSQVSIIEEKNNIIRLELKPVITAFSDCMVLSFSDKDQTDSKISWYNLILNIIGILQDFAYKMLCHGFLVRGAITSGKLFHERGVVLGPALIEAYELESKRAIIPRIRHGSKRSCFSEQ